MAIKLTEIKDSVAMTAKLKLVSLIFLSISLFFGVLFYTAWSIINAMDDLGQVVGAGPILIFLMVMSALTVTLIAMEFYRIRHKALATFKYLVIAGNAAMIGLVIHQLTNGYDALFGSIGTPEADAIQYTYASLTTGFAGVGTLLAILHNFHGIVATV